MGEPESVRWTCHFCGTGGFVHQTADADAVRCPLCARPVDVSAGPRRGGRHAYAPDGAPPGPGAASSSFPLGEVPVPRSARVPQWVLDEAAGRSVEPAPWRAPQRRLDESVLSTRRPGASGAGGRGRRGQVVAWTVVTAIVAVSVAARWWPSAQDDDGWLSAPAFVAAPADVLPGGFGSTSRVPTAGFEEAAEPLGAAPSPVWDGSPYAFIETRTSSSGQSTPVAWSPCRPIHVVVSAAGAPEGFEAGVRAVMGEITSDSGLVLTYDGTTDELPTSHREPFQPDRYGDRWAPVIVGFTDAETIPGLAGNVVGLAGPVPVSRSDRDYSVLVSGSLWLDESLLDEPATAGGPAWLPVLRHEFGHVIGLGHVDDPSQLMNPVNVPGVETYQAGDLYGLAQLGQGRCAPDF